MLASSQAQIMNRIGFSVTRDEGRCRALWRGLRVHLELLVVLVAHQVILVIALVRGVLVALRHAATAAMASMIRRAAGELFDVVNFAHFARPIANFPTRYVV